MHINIKYTNLESTPTIETYIKDKVSSLSKLLSHWEKDGGDILVSVDVGRTTKHHHKGPVYRAEINLGLPGKFFRAERENYDLRVAIDEAKKVLREEISHHHSLAVDSKKTQRS